MCKEKESAKFWMSWAAWRIFDVVGPSRSREARASRSC
jgi:hypothetical protein